MRCLSQSTLGEFQLCKRRVRTFACALRANGRGRQFERAAGNDRRCVANDYAAVQTVVDAGTAEQLAGLVVGWLELRQALVECVAYVIEDSFFSLEPSWNANDGDRKLDNLYIASWCDELTYSARHHVRV